MLEGITTSVQLAGQTRSTFKTPKLREAKTVMTHTITYRIT